MIYHDTTRFVSHLLPASLSAKKELRGSDLSAIERSPGDVTRRQGTAKQHGAGKKGMCGYTDVGVERRTRWKSQFPTSCRAQYRATSTRDLQQTSEPLANAGLRPSRNVSSITGRWLRRGNEIRLLARVLALTLLSIYFNVHNFFTTLKIIFVREE